MKKKPSNWIAAGIGLVHLMSISATPALAADPTGTPPTNWNVAPNYDESQISKLPDPDAPGGPGAGGSNGDPLTNSDGNLACENFCTRFMRSDETDHGFDQAKRGAKRHTRVSLDGKGDWSEKDEQWCVNRGSQGAQLFDVKPQSSFRPDRSLSCQIPLASEDLVDDKGNALSTRDACARANDKMLHCKFVNSQAESYCLSIFAAKDGLKWERVLLALDIAATATCTSACAAKAVGALEPACTAVGVTTAATELASTIAMKHSALATTINSLVSVGGGVAAVAGSTLTSTASNSETRSTGSCVAAVVFAAQTGIRGGMMIKHKKSSKKACQNLRSLASNALVPEAERQSYAQLFTPSGASGSGGGGNRGGFNSSGDLGSTLRDVGNSGIPFNSGAATDAGLLSQSGLDKLLAPEAAKMDLDKILGDIERNGPGPTLASALGGAGELGAAVAGLAQEVSKDPSLMGGETLIAESGGYSGGSGSRTPASGGDGMSGLANLFGGGGNGAPAAAAGGVMSFGSPGASNDIWHTGTSKNIFEIISEKVANVSGRVGQK